MADPPTPAPAAVGALVLLRAPLLTLALAAVLLAAFPGVDPWPILLVVVIVAAMVDGTAAGLASGIAAGATVLLARRSALPWLALDGVWGLGLPLVAIFVGMSKHRGDRLGAALQERRFQALVERASDAIALLDASGRVLYASPSTTRVLGYAVEDYVGRSAFEFVHPDDLERTRALFAELLAQPGSVVSAEYRYRHQSGAWLTMEGAGANHLADGAIGAIVVNHRDVSGRSSVQQAKDVETGERRRAEAALRASEARLRGVVDAALDAVITMDERGTITGWNPQAEAIFGWTAAEAVGRRLSDTIIPERDRPRHDGGLARFVATGEAGLLGRRVELSALRKDGRELPVELAVAGTRLESGGFTFSAFLRDITARRRHEERLAVQFAVTRVMVEARGLEDAAPGLVKAICDGLHCDRGELWRVDWRAKTLARIAVWPADGVHEPTPVALDTGLELQARIWGSGRTLWVTDLEAELGAAAAGGFASGFGFPAHAAREVAAVACFYQQRRQEADPALLQLLSDLQSRLGQFLDRERDLGDLNRLKKAVETVELGVTITDTAGTILYTNPAEAAMHGYRVEELIGKHVGIFMPPEWPIPKQRPASIRSWRRELVNVRRDGTVFPVQLLSDAVMNAEGRPIGMVTFCEEITHRKHSEEALRASEERYRLLFERNPAGVYRATVDGRMLDCNDAFARILGYEGREAALARTAWEFYFSREDREGVLERLREKGTLTNFELRMRKRDGDAVWVLENKTLLPGKEDGPELVEGMLIDITDRKQAAEQIEFNAYHDALTGLPNRAYLKDRLGLALAQARRSGRGLAVMFLDLDHFKLINDTLGHSAGDLMLQEVAARLRACLREDDTVARVGGDEFILLLPQVKQADVASRVARKILRTVEEPFRVEGHELFVSTSVGIAFFPDDGDDVETLLKNADSAMYQAKEAGRNNYQLCRPALEHEAVERLRLESALRHALERKEIHIHYQPQVDLASRRIVGMEALMRWTHPERGNIQPSEFIPLAEDVGLIVPLGEWVLGEACQRAKAWIDQGQPPLRVAVNLSVRQFRQPNLRQTVERALQVSGLPPGLLELEITESIAMQNFDLTVPLLREFVAMGISISIDDFGTGYSSLSYLKRLPIHRLKIDQSFVAGIGKEPQDTAIIRAIIGMAHNLGLGVVAEGVETEAQAALLKELECDEIQGYLFSRALPSDGIDAMLDGLRRETA